MHWRPLTSTTMCFRWKLSTSSTEIALHAGRAIAAGSAAERRTARLAS